MRRLSLTLALLCIMQLHGCGPAGDSGRGDLSSRPIKVVATVGMITDVVVNIGGDRVQATGLMGPGVDPHLYKVSAGDVSLMVSADVIFYNGLHLEGKMSEIFEQMNRRGRRAVAVTADIDPSLLLSSSQFQGAHDPHVWFDVALWMKAAEKVRDSLVEIDPTHREGYATRGQAYLAKLQALHEEVKAEAQRVPAAQRVVITAHDAFNYFGHAYGFEVRGLQGLSTATEAGTADVKGLAEFIVKRKIPAIFVESSVPKRNIEAVQAAVKARGFDVKIGGELFSDAMGTPGTPEGTYLGMVRHNVKQIVSALQPQ